VSNPLATSSYQAQRAAKEAERRFEQAAMDVRHATYLGLATAALAIVMLASGATSLAMAAAVVAGVALLISLSWRRAQQRERALWWQQARLSLVGALEHQREGDRSPEEDAVIIDLRERRPSVARQPSAEHPAAPTR